MHYQLITIFLIQVNCPLSPKGEKSVIGSIIIKAFNLHLPLIYSIFESSLLLTVDH